MQLSTRLGYADGFRKAVERAVELEERGVNYVWVSEAYGFDAVTRLGYLAARTKRMQIGAAILNIYSRTPAALAQTAAGLDEISEGRAILGLGASGPQVIEGFHGVLYDKPVQRTREIMDICRMIWRREVVEYHGKAYTLPLPPENGTGLGKPLKILTHPVRDRVPIYLASMGDRSVELTAEAAEGWLPIFFLPERADHIWGGPLRRGFAKRAESLGPLEILAGGALAIGEGLEHMRDLERPHLALYIGGMGARSKNFYNELACRYGFEREAAEIQDLYLSGRKKEAEAIVPQALLDGLSLVGPASWVQERIAAYREAGVTLLDVHPIGPDPLGDVERVKKWIS
ncbi:MAG: LLM class F420-dependent oxidoreductase [Chloroflexi bacterium]|nr:LLM class F420-dependent oxidoreductase [Chloroflexota bacterium]MBV9893067.1 LLM class F420-dependent oxidoreductase [Chloroflexota bacterium]